MGNELPVQMIRKRQQHNGYVINMINKYGALLKLYRRNSLDKVSGGPLTQACLADLLNESLGVPAGSGYCNDTIANWESQNPRRYTQIHKDNRVVLLSLIQIMQQHQSVTSLEQANIWLHSGNYRGLNKTEAIKIFGDNQTSNVAASTKRELLFLFKKVIEVLEE